MLDQFIEVIKEGMQTVFRLPELVTIFISVLPIVEARGAIPIAMSYNIHPLLAWLYSFIGSSMIVPLLLLGLLPLINWLGKTKLFKKAARVIYEKFEQKSAGILKDSAEQKSAVKLNDSSEQKSAGKLNDSSEQSSQSSKENLCQDSPTTKPSEVACYKEALEENQRLKKLENKKFWGVLLFVAIPLPLTGVWTGSAVAAILKLKYPKAILSIVLGNLIASGIITLLCVFFTNYINYIILAIGIIAILAVLLLIIKIITHKSPVKQPAADTTDDKDDKKD